MHKIIQLCVKSCIKAVRLDVVSWKIYDNHWPFTHLWWALIMWILMWKQYQISVDQKVFIFFFAYFFLLQVMFFVVARIKTTFVQLITSSYEISKCLESGKELEVYNRFVIPISKQWRLFLLQLFWSLSISFTSRIFCNSFLFVLAQGHSS